MVVYRKCHRQKPLVNMAIKAKVGPCIDCGRVGKLTAKRGPCCYWKHRATVNAEKAGKRAGDSPIAKKSDKQIERDIEYAKMRKAWLPLHKECEAKLKGCTHVTTQVHHMEGRLGILLFYHPSWLACCHNCHTWITEHSAEAIQMGLSLRRNT